MNSADESFAKRVCCCSGEGTHGMTAASITSGNDCRTSSSSAGGTCSDEDMTQIISLKLQGRHIMCFENKTKLSCKPANLIALVLDELFQPVHHEQEAVLINVAKVPSPKPAFRIEASSVGLLVSNISCDSEHVLIELKRDEKEKQKNLNPAAEQHRFIIWMWWLITSHDGRPSHQKLPFLANGQGFAGHGVHDLHLHILRDTASGTDAGALLPADHQRYATSLS